MTGGAPRLLLTRPQPAADRFLDMVQRARGAPVTAVVSPVVEIRPRPVSLELGPGDGVILASRNALRSAGVTGGGRTAWCVGDATAEAARAVGFAARSAQGSADDLLQLVASEAPVGRLVFLRGAQSAGDIAARLRAAGRQVDEVVVYDQAPVSLNAEARALLAGQDPVVVPLFSPRSARFLAEQGPFSAPLDVVAISRAAAAEWTLPARSLAVAERPDAPAMCRAVTALL